MPKTKIMRVFNRLVGLIWISLVASVGVLAQVDQVKVAEFARSLSDRSDLSLEELTVILNKAEYQESIVQKMDKPAEGTMTWGRYRNIFMKEERIAAGVTFWRENETVLNSVSEDSGVPVEIILGIIGVETNFGKNKGSYKVLDALFTLAFAYPKRSSYFTAELEKFILLSKKENLNIYEIKGSYAGAMGYCQFMPSSYEAYAKSYEEGSTRDLMQADDAIASVANYLKVHRWERGGPVALEVKNRIDPKPLETKSVKPDNTLRYFSEMGYIPSGNISPSAKAALLELEGTEGMEYWFGFNNFYVITRYNHSKLYAMAVYQLGEAIKAARDKS